MDRSSSRFRSRHAVGRAAALLLTLGLLFVAAGCADDEDGGGGTAQGTAATQPVAVTGGSSSLELDSTVDGILSVGGVSVSADGGAEKRDGAYAFPIREGELATTSPGGRVAHGGGIRLASSGRGILVRDLVIDLDEGIVTGTVGDGMLPVLQLERGGGRVERSGDMLTVSGLQASLTTEAADLVNARSGIEGPLGSDLVEGGQGVGELTIDGRTG